jgi:hypothetical protein
MYLDRPIHATEGDPTPLGLTWKRDINKLEQKRTYTQPYTARHIKVVCISLSLLVVIRYEV